MYPFERYADDAIIHSKTEREAVNILKSLKIRQNECKLELNLDKTRIVYCKDRDRKGEYLVSYSLHVFLAKIYVKERDDNVYSLEA